MELVCSTRYDYSCFLQRDCPISLEVLAGVVHTMLEMHAKLEIERVGLVLVRSNPMEENLVCQQTWLGIKLGHQTKICG